MSTYTIVVDEANETATVTKMGTTYELKNVKMDIKIGLNELEPVHNVRRYENSGEWFINIHGRIPKY